MSVTFTQNSALLAVEKIVFWSKDFENNINIDELRICLEVKRIMNWNFDFQKFYGLLCMEEIPLQILWNLHIFQVMPIDIYLLKLNDNTNLLERTLKFKRKVLNFMFEESADELMHFTQLGFLSYLINKAFISIEDNSSDINMFTLSLLKELNNDIFSSKPVRGLRLFSALTKCGTLEKECLHAFFYSCLKDFLATEYSPETDVYVCQENWDTKSDPFHLLDVISVVQNYLKCDIIENILFSAAKNDSTNWKHFIVLIASFLKHQSSAIPIMSKIASKLINDGIKKSNASTLTKAIIIGRQMSLNSGTAFPIAYLQWFQETFKDNAFLTKSSGFSFTIKTLTDLLPFENNLAILKLYLEKPPTPPPDCTLLYADYVMLVKTRVTDLQPKVNHEEILQKLLISFQETGKMPHYIIESSLMQKHQFLNEFLPTLLTPRVIPKIMDVREKFIEELKKLNKIPSAYLEKYKYLCQLEEERNKTEKFTAFR